MDTVRKYAGILMVLMLSIGFISCEDDESLFDEVVDHTWVGDLGFFSDDRYQDHLESGIYLGPDGFGDDRLCYYDTGEPYGTIKLKWSVGGGAIYLDYGNVAAPRELRNVYVNRGRLSASLYIDGRYYDEVELYME